MGEKGEKLRGLCVNLYEGMNSKRAKEILREVVASVICVC
jgi:hypothetical protein